MNSNSCHIWKLKKYARRNNDEWQVVDLQKGALCLVLQHGHLLVIQGGTVIESVSLITSHEALRGIFRLNTLVVAVVRSQEVSRKFRVSFDGEEDRSAAEKASDCVGLLKQYFTIVQPQNISSVDDSQESSLTVPQIYKTILDKFKTYAVSNTLLSAINFPLSGRALEDVVRLCLIDPSFPAFVGSVEQCLKSVAGNSTGSAERTAQNDNQSGRFYKLTTL